MAMKGGTNGGPSPETGSPTKAPPPQAPEAAGEDGGVQQQQDVGQQGQGALQASQPQAGAGASNMVKLFVGQIPKDMNEEALRPIFAEYGTIFDLAIIRDKATGHHRGCAFLTYTTKQSAETALDALHNKLKLPGAQNPLQVRPADVHTERENKLFIGMLPKTVDEGMIEQLFAQFGKIKEIHVIRTPEGEAKGCAFLKFMDRAAAVQAIEALNEQRVLEGASRPLVVKFADSKRHVGPTSGQQPPQSGLMGHAGGRGGQSGGLKSGAGADGDFQSPYWQMVNAQGGPHGAYPFQQNAPLPHNLMPLPYMPYGGVGANPYNAHMYYPNYFQQGAGYQQGAGPNAPPQGAYPYGAAGMHGGMGVGGRMSGARTGSPDTSHGVMGGHGMGGGGQSSPSSSSSAYGGGRHSSSKPLEGPTGANLFIYHLPHDLTDADLATAFNPFGNVISAKVYVDKNTGESKGFGFVSYDTPTAADAAIRQMNGFQIGSKRLKVQHKRLTSALGMPSHHMSHHHGPSHHMAHHVPGPMPTHDGSGDAQGQYGYQAYQQRGDSPSKAPSSSSSPAREPRGGSSNNAEGAGEGDGAADSDVIILERSIKSMTFA